MTYSFAKWKGPYTWLGVGNLWAFIGEVGPYRKGMEERSKNTMEPILKTRGGGGR